MAERQVQRDAVALLRKRGYLVHVTSDHRKSHHTKGLPDIIVSVGRGLWVGLEAKSATGKLSEEQEVLMRDGNIHVFRSPAEALASVQYCERQLT